MIREIGSNDRVLHDDSADPSDAAAEPDFNYQIFWIINSVAFLVFMSVIVYCCHKKGAGFIEAWTENRANGTMSDIFYASGIAQRMQAHEEEKKECPETRRQRLLNNFEKDGVTMVVKDEHFARKSEEKTDTEENSGDRAVSIELDELEAGAPVTLSLPDSANGNRSVPNCCAVCLCPYDVGDTLVWSSNAECQHAFHTECLLDWLKLQEGTPCPCCRQEFTTLAAADSQSKSVDVAPPRAFDVSSISIR